MGAFQTAQAQTQGNDFGYTPGPPSADLSGVPAGEPQYPPGSMAPAPPPTPKFYSGSPSELGQLRDSIMGQFPGVNDIQPEDEGFSWGERMGLMGIAMVNPSGALDMIRQKRDRMQKSRDRASQFNMHALTLASHVMDAQNNLALGVAQMNSQAAHWKAENDAEVARNETQRGMLRVQEGQENRLRQETERRASQQQMGMDLLSEGTDAAGNEVSASPGAPGFTSRASRLGLEPSFDEHGLSLAQGKPAGQANATAKQMAAMKEISLRRTNGGQAVDPLFAGATMADLYNIAIPTTDMLELSRRQKTLGTTGGGPPPNAFSSRPLSVGITGATAGLPADDEEARFGAE